MKRLFLTGEMGCGKSTAIAAALGNKRSRCGGFLTKRVRDELGEITAFTLESLDGKKRDIFLDFSQSKPLIRLQAFEQLGAALLTADVLVLDEIGGVELLSPAFMASLERVLDSDVPILGVLKGQQPANALIKALGMGEAYIAATKMLWKRLGNDPETLIYPCGKFDHHAFSLAKTWVEEYCP